MKLPWKRYNSRTINGGVATFQVKLGAHPKELLCGCILPLLKLEQTAANNDVKHIAYLSATEAMRVPPMVTMEAPRATMYKTR